MKLPSFLLATLIAFAVRPARADVAPNDFADIRWGTPPEAARSVMLSKPGVKPKGAAPGTAVAGTAVGGGADAADDPAGTTLEFEGGTFAGHPAAKWRLVFDKAGLVKGSVYLMPGELRAEKLEEAYGQLKKGLNQKYRQDGREERDRGIHKATYWKFDGTKGKVSISLDVNTPGIRLSYTFVPKSGPGGTVKTKKGDL